MWFTLIMRSACYILPLPTLPCSVWTCYSDHCKTTLNKKKLVNTHQHFECMKTSGVKKWHIFFNDMLMLYIVQFFSVSHLACWWWWWWWCYATIDVTRGATNCPEWKQVEFHNGQLILLTMKIWKKITHFWLRVPDSKINSSNAQHCMRSAWIALKCQIFEKA